MFLDKVLSCEYNNSVKQYWDTCLLNCLCYSVTYDSCLYITFGSIEENNPLYVKISPNPAANEIRIQNVEFKIKSIEIYDVMGKKVFEKHLSSDIGYPTISIADFQPGIYFLLTKTEKGILKEKLIKE